MRVHVDGANAESLKKALKKLRTRADRMAWKTLSKKQQSFLCIVTEPKPEEELAMLTYGELR